MVVYNITIKVDWTIHDEWLNWIKNMHIPEMMETDLFVRHQILRLLQVEEEDGPTYALQFYAMSLLLYNRYLSQYAGFHSTRSREKWGAQYVDFATVMEVVV